MLTITTHRRWAARAVVAALAAAFALTGLGLTSQAHAAGSSGGQEPISVRWR